MSALDGLFDVLTLGSGHSRCALLGDAGSLAVAIAHVVELGTTHVTAGSDFNLVDHRGVHREGALDADLEAAGPARSP